MKNLIKQFILICVVVGCHPVPAYSNQIVEHYGKLTTYTLFTQPDKLGKNATKYSDRAYSIEYGLDIDTLDGKHTRIGVSYYDQIDQSSYSKSIHNPALVELFGEQYWTYKDYYVKIGAGFKFYENLPYSPVWTERISSRFGIGKTIGNWEIELAHHSNWFTGQPFNDKWEYHFTGVSVGYKFGRAL